MEGGARHLPDVSNPVCTRHQDASLDRCRQDAGCQKGFDNRPLCMFLCCGKASDSAPITTAGIVITSCAPSYLRFHRIRIGATPCVRVIISWIDGFSLENTIRQCGLVVSTPAWDGTGCEFDSWQLRIYPMFTEPTITWVPSGLSGYIWLDTKTVIKSVWITRSTVYIKHHQRASINTRICRDSRKMISVWNSEPRRSVQSTGIAKLSNRFNRGLFSRPGTLCERRYAFLTQRNLRKHACVTNCPGATEKTRHSVQRRNEREHDLARSRNERS